MSIEMSDQVTDFEGYCLKNEFMYYIIGDVTSPPQQGTSSDGGILGEMSAPSPRQVPEVAV